MLDEVAVAFVFVSVVDSVVVSVETYAEQVEKNGWQVTAMAEAEEAGIITLICTKDDRILSFGTNFYDKKIMVEVIKSSKNTELLKKMLEESK